jgi:hypothetical protein
MLTCSNTKHRDKEFIESITAEVARRVKGNVVKVEGEDDEPEQPEKN